MASEIFLISYPLFLVTVAGALLWAFWFFCAAYLLILAIGATRYRSALTTPPESALKVCILIPAHNEQLLIGKIVAGLNVLEYPTEKWSVVVVADNCDDSTAFEAESCGAQVLVRNNGDLRGKGYALSWALEILLPDARNFDAFVIMDADSVLSPNFLKVMNVEMQNGHQVVQARYDVLNVNESWRTKLMACALALAHLVKPLGRRVLGLSDGLKGNGMCFSRKVLQRVPWSGESITEDIEYTLRLVESGIGIQFTPEANVKAQMPVDGKQAATQRQRWEIGRYALFRKATVLLFEAIRKRKMRMADRAFELVMPPFAELFAIPVVFSMASVVWYYARPYSVAALWFALGWPAVFTIELLYLAVGLRMARLPVSVVVALVFAPFYIFWKFGLYAVLMLRRGAVGWKRTERKAL